MKDFSKIKYFFERVIKMTYVQHKVGKDIGSKYKQTLELHPCLFSLASTK